MSWSLEDISNHLTDEIGKVLLRIGLTEYPAILNDDFHLKSEKLAATDPSNTQWHN